MKNDTHTSPGFRRGTPIAWVAALGLLVLVVAAIQRRDSGAAPAPAAVSPPAPRDSGEAKLGGSLTSPDRQAAEVHDVVDDADLGPSEGALVVWTGEDPHGSASLSGFILDEQGAPALGYKVRLRTGHGVGSARVEGSGFYEFARLDAGPIELGVQSPTSRSVRWLETADIQQSEHRSISLTLSGHLLTCVFALDGYLQVSEEMSFSEPLQRTVSAQLLQDGAPVADGALGLARLVPSNNGDGQEPLGVQWASLSAAGNPRAVAELQALFARGDSAPELAAGGHLELSMISHGDYELVVQLAEIWNDSVRTHMEFRAPVEFHESGPSVFTFEVDCVEAMGAAFDRLTAE